MYRFPEEMRKAYESSPLSFVYYQATDGRAIPVLASDGFCRNTGMDRDQVLTWLSTGMFERMHPDDVGIVSAVSKQFLHKTGPYDVLFRCRIGEGYASFHGFGKWQTMPDGTELAVICYVNVTETREKMLAMTEAYDLFRRDRFYTDSLTGLPNINYLREFGREKLDVIRSGGNTPHLVYMDICAMQSYNNQYGFKEGDELIRLVAATLREQFPMALVIRGADDHFVMLTSEDRQDELRGRMNAVNEAIRKNAHGNTLGVRSGICPVSRDGGIEEALDHARHALKRIETDMNRLVAFFSQAADDAYWKSRYIIENFDRALENGWIKVYYQAIYRVKTEKIATFEALARWVDPVRGIISPGDFIPVLQRYHQMYKLDLYMLEQVFREISIRYENGLPLLPVSVNFSRQDFNYIDVVGEMNRLYEKYELDKYIDRDYVIIEITEQDVAVGAEAFRDQLRKIRASGYRLWLDDFGSGYSAINMFSQYEFDLLKYDMDLLRHLDDNGGVNRLILKELVHVAKKLGIHTLAEGLETEEQLAFMREIGCELVQGFYFYKPEPLDDILFRLKNGMKMNSLETRAERDAFAKQWFE